MDNITQYLKYYIGCKIKSHPEFIPNTKEKTDEQGICILTPDLFADLMNRTFPGSIGYTWIPILRKLSSITNQEWIESGFKSCMNITTEDVYYNPAAFHFLISKEVWLFGDEAFDKGLVIDAETLNNKEV